MPWTIAPAAIARRLAGPVMLARAASCGGGGGDIGLTRAGGNQPVEETGRAAARGVTNGQAFAPSFFTNPRSASR